ncbi:GNAT family N-acetyltransferase [Tardiphaga alba]|uniref:GNAT family N-acetyltransferase n=1 Tax=Tardiphaga alba TaxID=340268 RepID=A0ABX8A846_9BRAD|nr:GNAT family N-acetyltransferase [Tardiphaga alba]QUS37985.1 GNAT family N-acetyltransferase [Tardiphaga alba]
MIDRAFLARLRIEPLDRSRHERAGFHCGVDRVDNFLTNTAARQQDNDLTRVYVACLDQSDAVIGYYALNAHAIDAASLPQAMAKKLPNYPTIAAIYLSIIGFHRDHQGKGGGGFLMADAFRRCVQVADVVGAHFLVLDALNERAAKLYRELGFIDLPDHEPRMIIGMKAIREAL